MSVVSTHSNTVVCRAWVAFTSPTSQGVCANPKCHESMMFASKREESDLPLGCCEHVASSAPRALQVLTIPKSSVNATDPVPVVMNIRKRYVANKNVIIGGLLLHQTRKSRDDCNGKFGAMAGAQCPESSRPSTEPFGIDPVFISTSSLYDVQTQPLACCRSETGGLLAQGNAANSTATLEAMAKERAEGIEGAQVGAFYAKSELNKQGTPYGFFSQSVDGIEDGFNVLIDINLREAAFNKIMAYLEEGFFLDFFTDTLKVELVTYNGENRYFCSLVVTFEFSEGGNILIDYSTEAANAQPYWFDTDNENAERAFNTRIAAEAVFVLLVLMTFVVEVVELVQCILATGSVHGYFRSVWNYIDLLSISFFCVCIAIWSHMLTQFSNFSPLPRYDVYLNNNQAARPLELKDGGAAMNELISVVLSFNDIMNDQVAYITMQGINMFLCLLRFLKYCDFQPRMGVVTRTLTRAFQDLAHFFALVFIVLTLYTFLGQIVFGSKIKQFSTLGQAARTVTSWSLGGDDRGVGDELFELPAELAVAGVLYYVSFAVIMMLMLLNFLIAIISEAYMQTQEDGNETASFFTELNSLVSKWFQAVTSGGKILTDGAARKRIDGMIAAEELLRAKYKKRHGMKKQYGVDGDVMKKPAGDPNDSDYSDEDDVVDKEGMVSFAGVDDDDINVDELKRVLQTGSRAAKTAAEEGLKAAKSGMGATDPLFDNIIKSIGDRVEKKQVGAMEKMTTEVHSLLLLVYKQNQELMKEVGDLRARAARQDRRERSRRGEREGESEAGRRADSQTSNWL